MTQITVMHSIWIQAPQERVWQAVTDPMQLSLWFAPGSPWEIPDLKAGSSAYFHLTPNAHHAGTEILTMRATIETVEPPYRFALRWEQEADSPAKIMTFTLAEENGGTLVKITETGYETQQRASEIEEGYGMSLENLKAHAEGRELPY